MARRRLGQLSLADGLIEARSRSSARLERIDGVLDWGPVEVLLAPVHASRFGAPGYPPLMMVKALLLQQWYALSDPGLQDALSDRLSFRRFVGLALDEDVPDYSTICRFRAELGRLGLTAALAAEVERQIAALGFVLKQGTIIDATLVASRAKRPPLRRDQRQEATTAGTAAEVAGKTTGGADASERPPSKLAASPVDPAAEWTRRGRELLFGYKGHLAVDLGSGVIRRAILTGASVNETTVADSLIIGDERSVWGDKAYDTRDRCRRLAERGVEDRIMRRGNKHHGLSEAERARNRALARERSAIERVFAVFKDVFGWRRVRYFGLTRNAAHLDLLSTAYNLRRLAALA